MSDVVFTAPAVDDLRRIGPDAVPKVLKRILLLLATLKPAIRWAGN